jgi:hypothetical protein
MKSTIGIENANIERLVASCHASLWGPKVALEGFEQLILEFSIFVVSSNDTRRPNVVYRYCDRITLR